METSSPAKNSRLIASLDLEEVVASRSVKLTIGHPRFASPLHLHAVILTRMVAHSSAGRALRLSKESYNSKAGFSNGIEFISIANIRNSFRTLAVNFLLTRHIQSGRKDPAQESHQ
jgi:hypothetical protein